MRQALRYRWGPEVFTAEDRVDRAAVARKVFGTQGRDSGELQFLECLTHPRIEACLARQWEQLRGTADAPGVVLDAALLFEAGWDRWCDRIVFVEVECEVRRQRRWHAAGPRNNLPRGKQLNKLLTDKRERADSIIDNSGTLEQTFQQVQAVWESFTGRASRIHSI